MYPKNLVRRVKRITITRWMSQNYALHTVLVTFDSIMDTLNYIKEIEGDGRSEVNAGGFFKYLTTKTFALTTFCFKILFGILENTLKL